MPSTPRTLAALCTFALLATAGAATAAQARSKVRPKQLSNVEPQLVHSQFVDDGTLPNLTTRNHGVHPDVGAFVRSGNAKQVLRGPARWFFRFFARAANRRADELRSEAVVSNLAYAR